MARKQRVIEVGLHAHNAQGHGIAARATAFGVHVDLAPEFELVEAVTLRAALVQGDADHGLAGPHTPRWRTLSLMARDAIAQTRVDASIPHYGVKVHAVSKHAS